MHKFTWHVQTIAVVLLIATWPTAAQTLNLEVARLTQRVDAFERETKAQLSRLMARQFADQVTQNTPKPEEIVAAVDTGKEALTTLERIQADSPDSLGLSADGQTPLIKKMLECVRPIVGQAEVTLDAAAGARLVASCDAEDMLAQLERNRRAALEAWDRCRTLLLQAGQVFDEHLPADPTWSTGTDIETIKGTLEGLKDLQGDADRCRTRLGTIVDDLKNMEDSASAMGGAMAMAGTMCMASGANPYVCGGAFAIALLMQLFGSGDGDGDGDGEPGTGGGYAEISGGQAGTGGDSSEPPVPRPETLGGEFGDDPNGVFKCEVTPGPKLSCVNTANATKTVINPKSVIVANPKGEALLLSVLNSNKGEAVGLCSTDDGSITALVVINEAENRFFSVNVGTDPRSPGESTVSFSPENPLPSSVERTELKAELCGQVVTS